MPPKKARKSSTNATTVSDGHSNDSDEDSDVGHHRRRKSTKTRKPNISVAVPPPACYADDGEDDCMNDDNDKYDDDNRAYMKIADDVNKKNVKLPDLFDRAIMPGFATVIDKTANWPTASRILEASAKVYGKRVDVAHTEVRKLDHEIMTRNVENEKKKKSTKSNDESLKKANECSKESGFFSDEDEETSGTQKTKKFEEAGSMNTDMTTATFDFDDDAAPVSSSDTSVQRGAILKKKLAMIAKDRTVLMGKHKRSAEEIEERLQRANAAASEYYRIELLRRGGLKDSNKKEKEAEADTTVKSYTNLDNAYYQFAMNKKREKRHVCIDDVAATTPDCSRIYVHNKWPDEESSSESIKNDDGPEDGDFIYSAAANSVNDEEEEDEDIMDGVLEQFQGTLEHATSSKYKMEDEWIEILGLEAKDLRPSTKKEFSFEQTANSNWDFEKIDNKLVDLIVIEGEDEAMKDEEDRTEKLVKQLFSGRVKFLGDPVNSNEDSIRREINSPPAVPMYSDEDFFFPFDQSKYVNAESFNSQIAASRSYFIKRTSIKHVDSFGIPDKLFEALRSLQITRIPDEILKIFETLPNYCFVNGLFTNRIAKLEYNQECQLLSSSIIPFRMGRYAEQVLKAAIHQVQICKLRPIFENREFRSQSNRSFYSQTQLSSFNYTSASKRPRLDLSLFNGDDQEYRYFAGMELEKSQRYTNQTYNKMDDIDIYKIVSGALSSEIGASAFLAERINKFFSPQAIYNYFAFIKFYPEYRHEDFSTFEIVKNLSEFVGKDFEELVENGTAEVGELHKNSCIPSTATEEPTPKKADNPSGGPDEEHTLMGTDIPPATIEGPTPMEFDHTFDNDFDAPSSPPPQTFPKSILQDSPDPSMPLGCQESQDIFANENDNDGAYEDDDDFGGDFFNDVGNNDDEGEAPVNMNFNDSLEELVGRYNESLPQTIYTRPKRNAKRIQFVVDDSHWKRRKSVNRKAKKKTNVDIREELQNYHDDDLLFAPRETSENDTVSNRRRQSSSALSSMNEAPRIPRNQDTSLPDSISDNTHYSYQCELGQTIPGNMDSDKIFMPLRIRQPLRRSIQSHSILYRGEYSFLPPTSSIRQENENLFWLRTDRLCSDLNEARRKDSEKQKRIEAANTNDSDMNYGGSSGNDYDDVDDYDFDVFDGASSHLPDENVQYSKSNDGDSFIGVEDDDESVVEIEDFDFESKINRSDAMFRSFGKFALKRAIKYILTKQEYDRSTLPDEIGGIKAPSSPMITKELIVEQHIPTSTPAAVKMPGRFVFDEEMSDDEEEIIGGDNHQNGIIEGDGEEESDFENDNDETRMKNFIVNGFHTLKSLLYYLPEICHPDTASVLSVAHVFCTLCHMANENSLSIIQETNDLNEDDSTSDCRITNLKEAVIAELENDLDQAIMESDEDDDDDMSE